MGNVLTWTMVVIIFGRPINFLCSFYNQPTFRTKFSVAKTFNKLTIIAWIPDGFEKHNTSKTIVKHTSILKMRDPKDVKFGVFVLFFGSPFTNKTNVFFLKGFSFIVCKIHVHNYPDSHHWQVGLKFATQISPLLSWYGCLSKW